MCRDEIFKDAVDCGDVTGSTGVQRMIYRARMFLLRTRISNSIPDPGSKMQKHC